MKNDFNILSEQIKNAQKNIYNLVKERPKCSVKGCDKMAQNTGPTNNDEVRWRKHPDITGGFICHKHHLKRMETEKQKKKKVEKVEKIKKKHDISYRKYRKDYCENYDGSILGVKLCTLSPKNHGLIVKQTKLNLLQADHWDGNHNNNNEDNIITLCPTCHQFKTYVFGDGQ